MAPVSAAGPAGSMLLARRGWQPTPERALEVMAAHAVAHPLFTPSLAAHVQWRLAATAAADAAALEPPAASGGPR